MNSSGLHQFIVMLALGESAPASQTDPEDAVAATVKVVSDKMGKLLGPIFEQTTLTGWLTLFGGIFLGLVFGRAAQAILRGVAKRLLNRGWTLRGMIFQHASGPANLMLFAMGLGIGFTGLSGVPENLKDVLSKSVLLLVILAVGWFIYNAVELLELALRHVTSKSATTIDDTVVLLLRKAVRIFVLIMFALFIAQNVFNAEVTAWLAGLGIAGLAVSLAAQDSIKNLFGSVMVLISRPFGLSDRIVFGNYDGVVENIGFRATKIRTLQGHVVTVPNMKFTDSTVENISARAFLARTLNIGLTYDTPPQKVDEALRIIKGILAEPEIAAPINIPNRPPRVFFTDFQADSLNIQVTYAYDIKTPGRDPVTYLAHAEQVNLKILHALNEAGIEFAFPTRTVFLAGDPKREISVKVSAPHAVDMRN